jgi:hypothetical protein
MQASAAILYPSKTVSQNPYSDDVSEKILSFLDIPINYFYANSPRIPLGVVNTAIKLHTTCKDYKLKCNATPGINGDIVFSVYKGNKKLEFNINSNLNIELVVSNNDEDEDFLYDLNLTTAIRHISRLINKTSCGLSELSVENIGAKRKKDLHPLLSTQAPLMVASRSYHYRASKRTKKRFVSTLKSSTLSNTGRGQFIGS